MALSVCYSRNEIHSFSLSHTRKSSAPLSRTGIQKQKLVPPGLQQEKQVMQVRQRKKTAQVDEELSPTGRNYMSPPRKRILGFRESFVPYGGKKLVCENVLP